MTMTNTTNNCCDICTLNHRTEDHATTMPIKVKGFRGAKLSDTEKADINTLWHLSRIESHRRYERMQYVAKWFRRRHDTDYGDKALWLAIDEETQLIRGA